MLPTLTVKHYSKVPKVYRGNLTYRKKLLASCLEDAGVQKEVMRRCSEDILFWVNSFCWLYEPRPRRDDNGRRLPSTIPFISWVHQDPVFLDIARNLGFLDMAIEKSRGEGATWLVLMSMLHPWLFDDERVSFALVSRNMPAVDNPDDPDSLFWKLTWQMGKIPPWMLPKGFKMSRHRSISKHSLYNPATGSSFVGYAAVGDLGSGGRKTCFIMDEFAKFPRGPDEEAMSSTSPATDCRILISTPKGPDGAYYRVMHEDSDMRRMILDWKQNPFRNRALYTITENSIKAVDEKDNPLPEGYETKFLTELAVRLRNRGFSLDVGQQRSPWYDVECLRPRANPVMIAQEYDRDYGGSVRRFFDASVVHRLIQTSARIPYEKGDLSFDVEEWKPRFRPSIKGCMKLWVKRNLGGLPPIRYYVVGADVAAGGAGPHSSNSVLSIMILDTGEKVAEMATPALSPARLANYAVAMCEFFRSERGPAFLIWEDNGPGVQFRNRIFETPFRNYYRRGVTDELTTKRSKKPGWWSNKIRKRELLGQYQFDLAEGNYLNPSREALQETLYYIDTSDGRIEHVESAKTRDETGARENHGDRVIADALTNWVRYEIGGKGKRVTMDSTKMPKNCFLARRQEALRKRAHRQLW